MCVCVCVCVCVISKHRKCVYLSSTRIRLDYMQMYAMRMCYRAGARARVSIFVKSTMHM